MTREQKKGLCKECARIVSLLTSNYEKRDFDAMEWIVFSYRFRKHEKEKEELGVKIVSCLEMFEPKEYESCDYKDNGLGFKVKRRAD